MGSPKLKKDPYFHDKFGDGDPYIHGKYGDGVPIFTGSPNSYDTGYTKTCLIAQNKILRNEQKFITCKKWLLDRRSRLNRLLLDDASWYVNTTS